MHEKTSVGRDFSRSHAECAKAILQTWRRLDHGKAAEGHKHNGLSTSLWGSDDNLVAGDAKYWWDQLGISAQRGALIEQVRKAVHENGKTWDDVYEFVEHPSDVPGPDSWIIEEGAEIQTDEHQIDRDECGNGALLDCESMVVPEDLDWKFDPAFAKLDVEAFVEDALNEGVPQDEF